MTMTVERFSEIVARIERAALYPAEWSRAVDDVVEALGADRGGLVVTAANCRTMTACSDGADDLRRSYNARYWRIDPIATALARAPAGLITTCEELLGPGYLRRHRFFSDWMAPHRLGDGMLTVLADGDRSAWLGAYPYRHRDLDRAHATATMRLLLPHLRHALTVQARLAEADAAHGAVAAVLDRYRHGVVIVTGGGTIGYANPAAAAIFAAGDGLAVGRRGHLESTDSVAAAGLRALITAATRPVGPRVGGRRLVPRRGGEAPYALSVLPLEPACVRDGERAALVVIVDPEREVSGGCEALRQLYGLTGAEARVAAVALRGKGLRAIAEDLAVSVNTARTHLQHVFDKSGTHRQAELVRLLTTVLSGTGQFDPVE
ncbi:helix-turn-helix transcriptional regulator [Nocardia shimofusensis]|uniref:helix-turn-helix transcriptional regulator n=1 Tax=Nocardia shimofusensis TaxID=228596 RepID=UPI0008337450|nr:helix-turn-helix transcriptional regulator [Nocardia shimofusensis]